MIALAFLFLLLAAAILVVLGESATTTRHGIDAALAHRDEATRRDSLHKAARAGTHSAPAGTRRDTPRIWCQILP